MAPLKFEEHIKDKLEQRKLQPSADAWQKLNNQLDSDASKKKNNKAFWWLGIAASIVGVLLVVTTSMNSGNENTLIPEVVDTENVDLINSNEDRVEIEKEAIKNENDTRKENELDASLNGSATKEHKSKKSSILKKKISTEQNKLVPVKTNNAIAKLDTKQINETQLEKINVIKTLSDEDQKINAIVVEMQKLQEQNTSALDSELDALLSEAQKEITLDKLYKQALKTVDAEALLQGVEEDIDVSFRDRVFKALKDSYKTVKTAVAERNN